MMVFLTGSAKPVTQEETLQDTDIQTVQPVTLQTPAVSCKAVDASYTVPQISNAANLPYSISISGEATGVQLNRSFDPNVYAYDLNALAAGQSVTVRVRAADSTEVTVDGHAVSPNQDYRLKITEISPTKNIVVTIRPANGTAKTYTIHTYSSKLPALNYTVSEEGTPQNGVYTFALSSYLIRMDTAGKVVYYRSFDFLSGEKAPLNFNFKPVQYSDGTQRFIYNIGVDNQGHKGGYSNGVCVVMDGNYRELKYIELQPFGWHQSNYLDDHDFILLSDDHWICESYTERDVDNIPNSNGTGKVLAGIIQEVDNGKVVMEFDTTDYPFLYETSQEKNDFFSGEYQDYCHVNSLCIDPADQNLIVSMRNQYAVYKIDRKTGQILWVLGGKADQFNLSANQMFVGQHAAYLAGDGSLLLYNNNTSQGQSEVLNFHLDEVNKAVTYRKSYTVSDYYGEYCGNAFETESGSHIIDWGLCSAHTSPVFTEVDPNTGSVISTLYTEGTQSYRTYKTKL